MIRLCERCYGPIEADELFLRLAHIDHAHRDGTVGWVRTYVHVEACGAVGSAAPGASADPGDWDEARRALSPAAARMLFGR